MIVEFLIYACLIVCATIGGFVMAYLIQLKNLRSDFEKKIISLDEILAKKVSDFDGIAKLASEANLSQAKKLIEMQERLDTVDSWRAIMMGSTTGWKK